MFDRDVSKFTDQVDIKSELLRFGGDVYLTKHLSKVYNPEFKVGIARLKATPEMSESGKLLQWWDKKFSKAEEVF
jgi:hypothetical protein